MKGKLICKRFNLSKIHLTFNIRDYSDSAVISKSSSRRVIKYPSKSVGLDFSLTKFDSALNKDSSLCCGILSQIIPNIFSFGNLEISEKCLSFVTNILLPDVEERMLVFELYFSNRKLIGNCIHSLF